MDICHMSGQYFRCWSTFVKLVYDVPRATYTYFVDNLLVPQQDKWRLNLLQNYIADRRKMEINLEETQDITS